MSHSFLWSHVSGSDFSVSQQTTSLSSSLMTTFVVFAKEGQPLVRLPGWVSFLLGYLHFGFVSFGGQMTVGSVLKELESRFESDSSFVAPK